MGLNFLTQPQFIFGDVMHKRVKPKVNKFKYKIYYLSLPLSKINQDIENTYLKFNRFGLLSFYLKDHGYRNDTPLTQWVDDIFEECGEEKPDGEIFLITMPRVFGYVFNPVSFFCCYDKNQNLRSVICEVNNTFGETHSYLCSPQNGEIIQDGDIITGQKLFHVSPFIKREGTYEFRFSLTNSKIGIWINHLDDDTETLLLTSVTGNWADLSKKTAAKAFCLYPLVTFKAIFLIHYQAIKLIFKGIKYVPKPLQRKNKISYIHDTKEK